MHENTSHHDRAAMAMNVIGRRGREGWREGEEQQGVSRGVQRVRSWHGQSSAADASSVRAKIDGSNSIPEVRTRLQTTGHSQARPSINGLANR